MWQQQVERARLGDLKAFDHLVSHFQDGVVGAAVAILGSFEDARDVAQETFIQAWTGLPGLRDTTCFPAWLFRIAHNRCHDLLRRARPAEALVSAVTELVPAGGRSDPAVCASRSDLRRRVLGAIGALSEPNRLAVTLFYINGYSIEEVAQFLEVPAGTVKRRLHDSRRRLQRSMMEMVCDSLNADKPGEELRARVAEELRARLADWDELMRRSTADDAEGPNELEWARWWHERRIQHVRANAAQYGIQPDEDLPRMLPGYRGEMTFRDDMKDIPRRWGVPESAVLVPLRDLCRELVATPLSVHRWEEAGLPVVRYDPWALYDRTRVQEWLAGQRPDHAQSGSPEALKTPLLTVLEAVAQGLATPEEGATLYDKLATAYSLVRTHPDPVWAGTWEALREAERRQNAANYGLAEPTGNLLGIPPEEERGSVYEVRDVTRRLGVSPLDMVRWTRAGMPCLRRSPLVRWDVRHVTQWLTEQGIIPERHEVRELDWLPLFVCRAVAEDRVAPEEAHEALAGWVGVM
jgi:RNA polymerase sigma-70 factor, ECF subfamily